MAPNRGQELARRLAAHVELRLMDSWDQGPYVVLMEGPNDEVDTVKLRSLSEPADVLVARLPKEEGVAACVSALGYVASRDGGRLPRRRARITVAVSCCSTSSAIRYTDGNATQSDAAEGPLIEALRSWASLGCCSCTTADAEPDGAPLGRCTEP